MQTNEENFKLLVVKRRVDFSPHAVRPADFKG